MAFIDPYEVYVLFENPDNLRGKKSPYHASRKRDRGPSLQHDVARPIQEAISFSSVQLGEIEGLSLGCTLEVNGWVFIPAVYVGL